MSNRQAGDMDEIAKHNRERWNGLARAGVQYSRPWTDLDETSARQRVDPLGLLGMKEHRVGHNCHHTEWANIHR